MFPHQILIPKWDYIMYCARTTLVWCDGDVQSQSLFFYDLVN